MSEQSAIAVFQQRLATAQQLCAQAGIDALVLAGGSQLQLLTGLVLDTHERFSALVVTAEQIVLITPAVDQHEVFSPVVCRSWQDGQDPYALLMEYVSGPRVAVSPELDAIHLLAINARLGQRFGAAQVQLSVATEVLKAIFMRKDTAAIAQLRAVGAAIDRVHAQVPGLLCAGRTEAAIAAELNALILQEHTVVDFVIVGSGPNGANPHHSFSERVLEPGDVVVVDIGGTNAAGYHSDCTRTYRVPCDDPNIATLADDPEVQRLYDTLLAAQEAAVRAVRPGVTAASIDAVAREAITAAGFGEFFIHRTGHGLGLSLHEEPFIMAGNELVLEPGMVFSVEPGIYIPGKVGARIEDIVVVTEAGVERLNNQPRTLSATE